MSIKQTIITIFATLLPAFAIADNTAEFCRVAAEVSVEGFCSTHPILLAAQTGVSVNPAVLAAWEFARLNYCNNPSKNYAKTITRMGCEVTIRKVGDTITLVCAETRKNTKQAILYYNFFQTYPGIKFLEAQLR